jgi:hypothetical protein
MAITAAEQRRAETDIFSELASSRMTIEVHLGNGLIVSGTLLYFIRWGVRGNSHLFHFNSSLN